MLTRDEFWALSQRDREYYTYLGNGSGGSTGGLTNAELRASAVPVVLPTGAVSDPWVALTAASGAAAAAGALNVTFWASSDFVGTVNGITFLAGAAITRAAPNGKTLPAYSYTRSAGTLYVARMA